MQRLSLKVDVNMVFHFTNRHDITEILLKVVLNSFNQTKPNHFIISEMLHSRSYADKLYGNNVIIRVLATKKMI